MRDLLVLSSFTVGVIFNCLLLFGVDADDLKVSLFLWWELMPALISFRFNSVLNLFFKSGVCKAILGFEGTESLFLLWLIIDLRTKLLTLTLGVFDKFDIFGNSLTFRVTLILRGDCTEPHASLGLGVFFSKLLCSEVTCGLLLVSNRSAALLFLSEMRKNSK